MFKFCEWLELTPITFASFTAFGPNDVIVWQSWWPVWSRNVNIKPPVVVNILPSVVMDVPSRKVGVVESVVFISQSFVLTSIAGKFSRWKCELFVDILRGWNEFKSSITF